MTDITVSPVFDFLLESNMIEGVNHVTEKEVEIAEAFLELPTIRIADIQNYANTLKTDRTPDLRRAPGMDVQVGQHVPMPGGPRVEAALWDLLKYVNKAPNEQCAWVNHCRFEEIHPFMDGNGRTGRLVWAWEMKKVTGQMPDRFLQYFYYQTLQAQQQ